MKISKHLTGLAAALFATSALAVPVVLDLTTDNFGGETSFGIFDDVFAAGTVFDGYAYDSSNIVIGNDDGYAEGGELADDTMYTITWDLDPGTYDFAILDSFGDGICCAFGEGSFVLSVDGTEIFSGGEFGDFAPVDDNGNYAGTFEVAAAVAEPSTLALLGLGMIGLAAARRRA